jgi:hypothetical protein
MDIEIKDYLQHGYAIIKKKNNVELTLVRMMLDAMGNVYKYKELHESKFKPRLIKYYESHIKVDRTLIKDFNSTIKELTIKELQALLPSYYYMEINARILELQEIENAVAKTKRSTKTTVKTGNRKRNI